MAYMTGQEIYGFYEAAGNSTSIDKSPVRLPDSPGKDELEWYEHSPIDASNQIRLIELLPPQKGSEDRSSNEAVRCKIHSPSIAQTPAYEALSYTWGKMNRHLVISVLLEGDEQALFVTPQLLMALRRLRLLAVSRFLWIDQLCIDQENDAEKGLQIQLMGDIYRKAERVVIWLGEDSRSLVQTPVCEEVGFADLLADLCRVITGTTDQNLRVNVELLESLIDIRPCYHKTTIEEIRTLAIYEILNRPWFRRAWVFQEASLARELLVQYGSWEVRFEDFQHMIDAVSYICATSTIPKGPRRRWLDKDTSGFEMIKLIQNARRRLLETNDTSLAKHEDDVFLSTLLQVLRRVEAFDPRDLIFAFLAFQEDEGITSTTESYKQTHEHVWKYATECIIKSSKSFDVFAALCGDVDRKLDLPSWVPSWSECFPYSRPIAAPGSRFRASRRMPHFWNDCENSAGLMVRGKIIDIVTHFPTPPISTFRGSHHHVKLFLWWLLLVDGSKRYLYNFQKLLGDILEVKLQTLEVDLMRTVLADGAMGSQQPLRCVPEMVKIITHGEHVGDIRDAGRINELTPEEKEVLAEYEKLEDLATVAELKRVFFTENLQLGMAPSAIQPGDQIAIIHGSKVPLVLRQISSRSKEYSVISQCYLEGWMYGNPPKERPHPHGMWWKEEVDEFILV
jgi:Heterokaryon incompatibility protein (HET)